MLRHTTVCFAPRDAFSAMMLVAALAGAGRAAESSKPRALPLTATKPAPASPDEALAEKFSLAKAAESLDRVSLHWTRQHQCGSCHATFPYLMSRGVLKEMPSPAWTEVRAFCEGRLVDWEASPKTNEHLHPEIVDIAAALAINDAQTTSTEKDVERTGGRGLRSIQFLGHRISSFCEFQRTVRCCR